jgi:16S rRNA (uracil1498-N3)-methyltransferase
MHRFYLKPEQSREPILLLVDDEAHHALHVVRVRSGEKVAVLDGAGHEFLCEVQSCERAQVLLKVLENRKVPSRPQQLTLVQAVPKGKLMDSLIQKATELGVSRVVPLLSERVVIEIDDSGRERKRARWQSVAVEAIKQCGSAWLPSVEAPVTPEGFLRRKEHFELALVASLKPGSKHPREYFNAFQQEHGAAPKSVCIWVGPEGDFTPAELEMIEAHGALPISLGRLVLRVETAATYCLSVVNYELASPGAGLAV